MNNRGRAGNNMPANANGAEIPINIRGAAITPSNVVAPGSNTSSLIDPPPVGQSVDNVVANDSGATNIADHQQRNNTGINVVTHSGVINRTGTRIHMAASASSPEISIEIIGASIAPVNVMASRSVTSSLFGPRPVGQSGDNVVANHSGARERYGNEEATTSSSARGMPVRQTVGDSGSNRATISSRTRGLSTGPIRNPIRLRNRVAAPVRARNETGPVSNTSARHTQRRTLYMDNSMWETPVNLVYIEVMMPRGQPPLQEEIINEIAQVQINADDVQQGLQCSICLEHFCVEEMVRQLECSHMFHCACIGTWLGIHATCPICRMSLNTGGGATVNTEGRPPTSNAGN